MPNTGWDITGNQQFRHDRYISSNGFEMRWATVLYFTKSQKSIVVPKRGDMYKTTMNTLVNFLDLARIAAMTLL